MADCRGVDAVEQPLAGGNVAGGVWRADADYIARYEQRWASALGIAP
jgi:hypothetical protein